MLLNSLINNHLKDPFNPFWSDFWTTTSTNTHNYTQLPTTVTTKNGQYELEIDVAGVDPKDIKIHLESDLLLF